MLGIEHLLQLAEARGETLAHRVCFFLVAGRDAGVARIEVAQTDLLSRFDSQLFHDARRCYNAWVTPQSRFPLAGRPRLWGTAVSHYQVEGDARVLAEDQAIGVAVKRAGFDVVLSPLIVPNVVVKRSLRRALDRQIRWNKIGYAFSRPTYSAEVLLNPLPFALLAGVCFHYWLLF